MAITFNDTFIDIYEPYTYDSASDTYTSGAKGGVYTDYFSDTAVVGDAILFAVDRQQGGKFNEIKFDVATPLVADSIAVIWEYCRVGANLHTADWYPLTNVTDGTNAFQNAGVNSVTFDCPEDWENYLNPNYQCKWYAWNIRCRIVSVTNLTEGGKQSSTHITVKPKTIWVSGYSETTPCTLQDIYDADVANSWNVVTKNTNAYTLDCGLYTDKTTGYFTTKQEVIQFLRNWDCWFYGVTKSGEIVSGDKCKYGSTFIFNQFNGDLGGRLAYIDAEIYNTQYRYVRMEGAKYSQGHWGGSLGTQSGQKIYDVYAEGIRQLSFSYDGNVIMGIKAYNTRIEAPGAIIKNVTCYGGSYSVLGNHSNIGDYVHECDFSGATTAPVYFWLYNEDNIYMYFVDCNWGVKAEENYGRWHNPGANDYFYAVNSFLLKVIDRNSNPISGATIILKNKNSEVFRATTSSDGYPGQDSGAISSATAGTLVDTSKNWTANQWWFKEVYITSGTGVGQRRIIKKGNTATELQVAPDWDITPDSTSKYIIIPYVNVKKFEPQTPDYVGYSWATTESFNPFTLTVEKAGYKPYKVKMDITEKIDWTIKLKKLYIENFNVAKK